MAEKIIDFDKKGNVVRFYLGTNDEYWGDDWDDAPYEHNAGSVYPEFITRTIDIVFPYDAYVMEPADDWSAWQGNTPYAKENMKHRDVPCIIVVPEEIAKEAWLDETAFAKYVASDRAERFYFNDPIDVLMNTKNGIVIANNIFGKEGTQ